MPEVTITYGLHSWEALAPCTVTAGWSQHWAEGLDELWVLRLSNSETVWPWPWLAAPAISHQPHENIFIGGGPPPFCKESPSSTLLHFLLSVYPVATSSSSSASLCCPALLPCRPLSTHFLNRHTCTPSRPCGKGLGGASGRINFLFWPSKQLLPDVAMREWGKRAKREEKAKRRWQTRTNTHHWFHC